MRLQRSSLCAWQTSANLETMRSAAALVESVIGLPFHCAVWSQGEELALGYSWKLLQNVFRLLA